MLLGDRTTPTPGTSVPPGAGGMFTHRRGALEFGSAVGEVVGGSLAAHWFQLEREKGQLDSLQSWETLSSLRGCLTPEPLPWEGGGGGRKQQSGWFWAYSRDPLAWG